MSASLLSLLQLSASSDPVHRAEAAGGLVEHLDHLDARSALACLLADPDDLPLEAAAVALLVGGQPSGVRLFLSAWNDGDGDVGDHLLDATLRARDDGVEVERLFAEHLDDNDAVIRESARDALDSIRADVIPVSRSGSRVAWRDRLLPQIAMCGGFTLMCVVMAADPDGSPLWATRLLGGLGALLFGGTTAVLVVRQVKARRRVE